MFPLQKLEMKAEGDSVVEETTLDSSSAAEAPRERQDPAEGEPEFHQWPMSSVANGNGRNQ